MMCNKIIIIIILSLVQFSICNTALCKSDKYQSEIPIKYVEWMEDGREARLRGDLEKSIQLFESLLKERPDYYLAHYNLALSFALHKKYEEAIKSFKNAIRVREKKGISESTIFNSFGWTYFLNGNYEMAKKLLLEGTENQANLSNQSKGRLFNNLGLVYMAEGNIQMSKKWLLKAEAHGYEMATLNLVRLNSLEDIPTIRQEEVKPKSKIKKLASTKIITENKTVYSIDSETGEKMFVGRQHRKGLYRVGFQNPETFIGNYREMLLELNLTDSEINVILATSENAGNFDAVNTWDNQYISFGMFQWTAGGPGKPGELPVLVNIIKEHFPDDFQHYWGQFGLDVVDVDSKTGWFSYRGKKLASATDKAMLREHIWAYRFASAGADIEVQAVQILHAVNRINHFYSVKSSKLDGYALADLITSEYGVALLLDNHVNRPGYVMGCVSKALERSNLSTEEMIQGGDREEKLLIKNYLDIRQTYGKWPMTDARHRAAITRTYVVDGIISDSLGSFVTGELRGGSAPSVKMSGVLLEGLPWMVVAFDEMDKGVYEFRGPESNPRIIEYHQATSLKANSDEIPWNSSFVNWVMEKAGYRGTNSATARSWLKWGVELAEPQPGCIAVFSRGPNPAIGHVGFYIKEMGARIQLLGGNQSNKINISSYPKSRYLGCRWPIGKSGSQQ